LNRKIKAFNGINFAQGAKFAKENKKEVNLAFFVYPVAPEDGTGASQR